jgi:NAD(P)-dependent dehydrogenase (short-subunit alcohol dehydrogenase family)
MREIGLCLGVGLYWRGGDRRFVLPCYVFGAVMRSSAADATSSRSIVNISSMASQRAISGVVGYAAAKAAVENFTRWLAVDCARRFGDRLRVNAIAPGFFIGEQNRALLRDERDEPTPRGRAIIEHTPAGGFGEPHDLVSTLLWLCSPTSGFVTGVVVPVDGGFSAFSGVCVRRVARYGRARDAAEVARELAATSAAAASRSPSM